MEPGHDPLNLERILDMDALSPFTAASKGQLTGHDCLDVAATMSVGEAISGALGELLPLPDMDSAALSKPQSVEELKRRYAIRAVLRAALARAS